MARSFLREIVVGVCLLLGVGPAVAEPRRDTGATTSEPRDKPDAEASRRAQVVARFEGGQVTLGQLEDAISNKAQTERRRLQTREAQVALLRAIIDYELLAREAARRGLADDPRVQRRTRQEAIDLMAGRDLLVEPASIPMAQIEARYRTQIHRFQRPEQRRASLLVLDSQQTANKWHARLAKQGRTAFLRAAREHSVDSETASRSGQLGFFDAQGRRTPDDAPWQVPREVVEAAFATPRGKVSPPFALGDRHALVQVTGVTRGLDQSLEAATPTLRLELAQEAQRKALDEVMEARKRVAGFEAHPERLESIRLELPSRSDSSGVPAGVPAAPRDPSAPAEIVEPDGF